jgi:hypothetical protein
MAETMFGERDKSYTILGIEFSTEEQPGQWYPRGVKDIVIQLTESSAVDEQRALFQLAHEAFHLLSPGKLGTASRLEEGFAVYFSLLYMQSIGSPLTETYIADPKYRAAYDDVVALLQLHPEAPTTLKRMRGEGITISSLTQSQFQIAFPEVPDALAARLTDNFLSSR